MTEVLVGSEVGISEEEISEMESRHHYVLKHEAEVVKNFRGEVDW